MQSTATEIKLKGNKQARKKERKKETSRKKEGQEKKKRQEEKRERERERAVSYTHLTLPTRSTV